MNQNRRPKSQWQRFCEKMQPAIDKAKEFYEKALPVWNYVKKFKKLFLAAPVAAASVLFAIYNLIKLPVLVGFGLQGNGEFSFEIIREVAVLAPLLVTAICLLLMFASKRTLTPWMVSLFSLLLPWMILITNTFPG